MRPQYKHDKPASIEDYALLGDLRSAALVDREGCIDWLCLPRFDSAACFAALLGTAEHGHWLIRPASQLQSITRRYRGETLVLETEYRVAEGAVHIIDFMATGTPSPQLVRIVEGIDGRVPMWTQLVVRFNYGAVVPWARHEGNTLHFIGGPDALRLRTPVKLQGEDFTSVAEFYVRPGERVPFVLSYQPSHEPAGMPLDAAGLLEHTERGWREWSEHCSYRGPWKDAVMRSLLTLKALTYAPTGGMVAAPTTSLPEALGGVRNWDYRYCWLRDAAYTLYAFLMTGYREEATAWRDWLLRAVAGRPQDLQIVYGLRGERQLLERELDWLPGYQGAVPVRTGNAASRQFQLDVYGEVIDVLALGRDAGIEHNLDTWGLKKSIMDFLESNWNRPDCGIWEVRGPERHFTHSKIMAWRAFNRAIRSAEAAQVEAPLQRWCALRDEIHADICRHGFNRERNAFVQYYGSGQLDASLLIIPLVGFLPADDPRMLGTVTAIGNELMRDGLVLRYAEDSQAVDGLPPGEGTFLPLSFLYADNLALSGQIDRAQSMFERLLGLANDIGLFAEEYEPRIGRMLGNFPQALTHVAVVNTAVTLERAKAMHGIATEGASR